MAAEDNNKTPAKADDNVNVPVTKITETYPVLPLRDIVVFPYMVVPLFVGRKKSVRAIEEAMLKNRKIVVCAQKNAKTDDPKKDELFTTATVAEILQLLKMPDGILKILVEGTKRINITNFTKEDDFFEVEGEVIEIEDKKSIQLQALMRNVVALFEQYVKLNKKIPLEIIMVATNVEEPGRLADIITAHLNIKLEEKQDALETFDPSERLDKIASILNRELEIMMVEKKIRGQVRKQMEQIQKEYYLREQMKAIQKELGDDENRIEETEELKEAIIKAGMTDDAREKAQKELAKLMRTPSQSPEAQVSRNYLDALLALPWSKETKDRIDLKKCQAMLDDDHYGLEKVKERILEYLAVCHLKKSIKGPILCLIGPPGVGKTSLGRSIAKALNRKFARISLGGVRDEAEIRGHRRTYIGAMPGRIIQALQDAGSKNPVILLDEIDKLGADYKGDPSSALLEALDPEQNVNFSDHYISTPFDLSKVLFLTTANVPHTIPGPLRDRLEIVYLSGYTEEEKLNIAMKYLVPKQLEANGIAKENIKIDESAIIEIIRKHTREAGVRNLDRELASVCRKIAKDVVMGMINPKEKKVKGKAAKSAKTAKKSKKAEKPGLVVSAKDIERYLGIPKFHLDKVENHDEIGLVNGLAWTEVGGTTLPIEAVVMPGRGKVILTGSLGDVMKESAQAAISYLRSHAKQVHMRPIDYDTIDLHLHFPEGAVPKDGPSAGIAITTAIYSALNEVPVRSDFAMTGEITLRGKVLPVGGIKEKLLAAHRQGINNIILSADNEKELEELPEQVRKVMKITQIEYADEALKLALNGKPKTTLLSFKKPKTNSLRTEASFDSKNKSSKAKKK
ncbi:MAG: endopeptidase La [Candidatus Riflebacteria bacterium]|nr:endopeptidase La [Candidatus Riflebacteria bacterium]MBR4570753.1 endopeptidase La [Candidatus Riflebacteria bacterium]